ncbi:MAG TPA: hypothetical protein VL860_05235, partial [Planctomycetota bacterium]|nr:hypothetical protein [Planctomycetota bacterium]
MLRCPIATLLLTSLAVFSGCDETPNDPNQPQGAYVRDPYAPVPMGGVPSGKPRSGATGGTASAGSSGQTEARLAQVESKLDEALKLL